MLDFEISGDKEIDDLLRQFGPKVIAGAIAGVDNWLHDTAALAVTNAPEKTGALKKSAWAKMEGTEGKIAFAVHYAALRHEISKKPFYLLNAVLGNAPQIMGFMIVQVGKSVRGKPTTKIASAVFDNESQALAAADAKRLAFGP